jgi:hypothetical protein
MDNPFAAPQTELLTRRRRSRAWRQVRRYVGAAFFFGGAALIYFLLLY